VSAGYLVDNLKLGLIGILILINHHILKLGAVFVPHSGVALEQLGGEEQDIVEIHCLIKEKLLLV
jgi:hypothetical protein